MSNDVVFVFRLVGFDVPNPILVCFSKRNVLKSNILVLPTVPTLENNNSPGVKIILFFGSLISAKSFNLAVLPISKFPNSDLRVNCWTLPKDARRSNSPEDNFRFNDASINFPKLFFWVVVNCLPPIVDFGEITKAFLKLIWPEPVIGLNPPSNSSTNLLNGVRLFGNPSINFPKSPPTLANGPLSSDVLVICSNFKIFCNR